MSLPENLSAPPAAATPVACGVSAWWRATAIGSLLALALGVATSMSMFEQFKAQIQHLQVKLKDTSQIKYIAVLNDDKHAPAMLVTLDPQEGALQIQRLNAVSEGREDSMQLWALPASGQPRSLGVLESKGKTLRLSANDATLANASQLAISVEDKGGVPESRGPRLPYLFKGTVVQKAL